jgi:hypothetical protein
MDDDFSNSVARQIVEYEKEPPVEPSGNVYNSSGTNVIPAYASQSTPPGTSR